MDRAGTPTTSRLFAFATALILVLAGCSRTGSDGAEDSAPAEAAETSTTVTLEEVDPEQRTTTKPATTTTEPPNRPNIDWDELPPVDATPDLVQEGYEGRLLVYGLVIDEGNGPVLCGMGILTSDPPQCEGIPIVGLDWDTVDHELKSGTRFGDLTLIGNTDYDTFTLSEPAFNINYFKARQTGEDASESESTPPPCPEPEGGWWSDTTDGTRVGSQDYNEAIDVVNRRELIDIDIYEPDEARPDHVNVSPSDTGWTPGVLVIRMPAVRPDDEERIRASWGGPLCLVAEDAPTIRDLDRLVDEIFDRWTELVSPHPGAALYRDGDKISVVMNVATVEAQERLDAEYGPGLVEVSGRFWPIDQ